MNRRRMSLAALLAPILCLGLVLGPSPPARAASMQVEVIPLHNRTADEVIPLLRPFLTQGGAMSGTGYKLIVKTTPQNLTEIQQLLKDIDAGLRQLVISVRQGSRSHSAQSGASARLDARVGEHGRVTAGGDGIGPYAPDGKGAGAQVHQGGSRASGRVYSNQSQEDNPAEQHIRVMEGQWANITAGTSFPIIVRQRNPDGSITATVHYREATTGFQVLPRVNGNRVTLQIRPTKSSLSRRGGGVVDTQQAKTTVSGQLGQWIDIGGVSQSTSGSNSGIAYQSESHSEQTGNISVKVDLAQ